MFGNSVIAMMEKEGLLPDHTTTFYILGNVKTPKVTIILQKVVFLEQIIHHSKYSLQDYLFIASPGVPCKACLDFVHNIKCPTIIYFGDLSPVSILTCLTYVYLDRAPGIKAKPKECIVYGGITTKDAEKYLSGKKCTMPLTATDKAVLKQLEMYDLPYLKDEMNFLKSTGKKVEMVALHAQYGFDKYLENKLSKKKGESKSQCKT